LVWLYLPQITTMRQLEFTEGFKYKGFRFAWKGSQLYRLPITKNGRSYSLKKIPKIKIANSSGFRVARDKKSVAQVLEMIRPMKKVTVNVAA
jgi:hypothetical protein